MNDMARNPVSDADFVSYTGRRRRDSFFSIGKLWKAWKGIVAFSAFLSLFLSSFLATFDTSILSMVATLYACDAIYLADTIIRIKNCIIATRKGKLSRRMLFKLWLPIVVDVITLLPFEVLAIGKVTHTHPWLHVSRQHRLNRLARFYKLFTFCRELEDEQGANIILIRTFKHTFVTFAALHLIACGWYALGCEPSGVPDAKCYPKGWALLGDKRANPNGGDAHGEEEGEHGEEGDGDHHRKRRGAEEHHEDPQEHLEVTGEHMEKIPLGIPIPEMSTYDRYLVCLYWSTITATSTGYGDVHAVDDFEKLYSILCMMVGVVFFFGTILGDMGSALTNSDQKRAVYKHKLDAVIDYMHQRNIKDDMENVVHGFYEYMWGTNQAAGRKDVFQELPITFQAELSLNVNKHILEKVPLFKDTSVGFKRMLSMHITQTTYFPAQLLFRENDIGHSLYYVRRGEVQIFKGGDDKPLKSFKEGSYFGEIALVVSVPRSATARAISYCDILSLDRTALNNVIRHFPDEFAILQSAIQERYQKAEMNKDSKGATYVKDVENMEENTEESSKLWRLNLKKLYNELVISPSSTFYAKWRTLVFCTSLLFLISHTWIASFKVSFHDLGYGDGPVFISIFALWYLYDFILVLDILIHLRTTIDNPEKGIVNDPKEIRKIQMKTWKFLIDITSVLPIEILAACFATEEQRWVAATFLRSNRLLRIYHIPTFFDMMESNINMSIAKVRSCRLIMYIFLTTHLTSCVWFLQACSGTSCAVPSWANKLGINETHNEFYNYLVSVYWSCATMTSTGYGDISAMSRSDEIVVLAVLIIGLLLYGYCVCSICSALIHLLAPRNRFMEHIDSVSKFLRELKLGPDLISDVQTYLSLVWTMHKGQSLPGTTTLINDMPQSLQENVAFEQMKDILKDVPLFRDTDERFQKMLSVRAKTFLYMPGDTIVHTGDLSRDLYIVRRGHAEVISADRSCVVATFGPGGYFGEAGLLYGESRLSDVRAKTYCEIVVISKKDLDETLPGFPVIAKQLEHISENIEVLEKLQATARDEAKRSAISQLTTGETREVTFRKGKQEKGNNYPPNASSFKTGGSRKTSLPAQFGLGNAEKDESNTPEYRKERILVLEKEEQQEYYTKLNPFLKVLSNMLMTKSISPDSQHLKRWTLVSSILAYFYLLLAGFHISFAPETLYIHIIGYTLDVFFLVDIYIKLHVGFYNEKGILVTCTLKTAGEYLKTSFLFDFLAVIPFDLMMISYHEATHFGKLNRLLHLVKVVQYFSFFYSPIGRRSYLIRLLGMNSYLVLIAHYFACGWFFFACDSIRDHYHYVEDHEGENGTEIETGLAGTKLDFHHRHFRCGEHSWAGRHTRADIQHERLHFQYIVSMYWTFSTLCSVGYGDIHAYLSPEMVLSAFCMAFGVVYFGYVVAYVSASLSSENTLRSEYQDDLDGLKIFLQNQEVETSLRQRVLSHFVHIWRRTLGVDMKNLFQGLPNSIQGSICFSLYQSMLFSVPIFKEAPTGFIKLLARHIKPIYILKDEYIVKRGDKAREIFFVHHGTAEIVTDDEKASSVRDVGEGHFFGEVSVICNGPVYTSIRAQTNTDLFVLSKEDLDMILNSFPHIKKSVKNIAEEMKVTFDEQDAKGVIGFEVQQYNQGTVIEIETKELPVRKSTENTDPTQRYKPDGDKKIQAVTNGNENGSAAPTDANASQGGFFATLREWRRFVIRPDNPLRHIRIVNGVGMYIVYLTITFMGAFHEYSISFFVLSYLWEASFLFEMFLNFHMYYTLENQDVIDDYDMTFNHYLKGEFIFDSIANFPLEIFCFAFPSDKRIEMLCFLRFIHILRLRRVHKLFEEWLSRLNINIFMVTLFENIAEAFVIIHGFSCIWYLMACSGLKCSDHSWIAQTHTHADPFSRYFDCFYWAVATMTSTGYGDIHATNVTEMIYSVIVMVAGRLVFGLVLGKVTSTLATTEAHRVHFEDKVKEVQAHMRARHIQRSLQCRVLDFFRASWLSYRGVDISALLLRTPFCLRADMYVTLIGDIVRTIPIFEKCSEPFIRHLCCQAHYSHFCSDEFVTRIGDVDENLYIIKRGEIEGIVEGNNTTESTQKDVIVYKEGGFFGEENVLTGRPSTMSIKTKTDVDLFVIPKSSVHHVIKMFQDDEQLADLAARCFRRLSVIDEE